MRKIIYLSLLSLFMTSCGTVGVQSPIYGVFYTKVKGPFAVTGNENSTKVGTASAKSICGIAKGDASIETACKSAGITKIHHVDVESKNILSIVAKYKVIVYGE